ncbi:hypothetical protein [Gluconobacter frateurii]|uniref:Uncharacterized protein n=1 Tax=Gluconobacter frateurii NRIC 0228 TaxID=1307946 RepID=A0ABQ0QED4_9PROT|nr:hypothetical protein [Gluconobacter frateurii]GBR15634.1 hypothetical protein AA0228_2565 [Gluconobacter frateurii NRIC 0228]GLP90361.1 hypothetical protein GCM10007868_14360 [Gluconobacter frateurii]
MDTHIVYPGQIPQDTDLLLAQKLAALSLGGLGDALYGRTAAAWGFSPTLSSTALTVTIGAGVILASGPILPTALGGEGGGLPADTTITTKQYLLPSAQTLTFPGTGGTYTLYALCSDVDTDNTLLPFWWMDRFASDGSGTDYQNETVNYGVSVGGLRGSVGTIQEHIAMNPKAYPNGIGLCGYNSCAYVDSHGKFISGGDILTGNGSALYTVDPNGSNAAYEYSDANYQVNIAFNPQSGTSTAYSGAQGAQALHIAGSLVVDQNINTTGNLQVELGKSFGLLDGTGSLLAFQYLADATTTVGPIAHQVVENKNGLPGTYFVDGAFGTGGAAKLASLDVVNSALFEQGSTIPSGKSYAVQSAAGTTYWTADNSGNFIAVQGAPNTGGGFKAATYTLSALPASVASDGTQVWCSDCKLNGITGVAAYWHASASKWTDGQNGTLAN